MDELRARTRYWGLSDERPNDVLLEDGSGRLILRGFQGPNDSGWPPPWYARDAVDLAKALPSLMAENDRLRAAVAEGDRIIERLRERIHPTMGGYCPACGGGCLIGFATPTPARDALEPATQTRTLGETPDTREEPA